MKTKSGVYSIRCKRNEKTYVGSSINIPDRWSHHIGMLNRGAHHNIYLQRAWQLYGSGSFVFDVLEYVSDVSEIANREQAWIEKLNSLSTARGFNIAPRAMTQLGFKHSESTKRRLSEISKGKKKPEGFGERVSTTLRARGIKPSLEALRKAAEARRGRPPSQRSIEYLRSLRGKKQSAKHIEKRIAPLRKKYVLTSPDGIEFFVDNLPGFCKENDLQGSHICHVCREKRKHHKGWKARYAQIAR